jgi:DNA replication protein DnaC
VLNEPTLEKLKTLRLDGMLAAWTDQQKSPEIGSMAFDDRLGILVDAEWMHRENKRIKRSLKEAKLRLTEACIEGIEYSAKRELDKAVIRQLQTCRWIQEHQAVLVTGATGTGKSYLACALAQNACRRGFRAIYRRARRLFDELKIARADGSYRSVLARLARVDVLVIDSCGAPHNSTIFFLIP